MSVEYLIKCVLVCLVGADWSTRTEATNTALVVLYVSLPPEETLN